MQQKSRQKYSGEKKTRRNIYLDDFIYSALNSISDKKNISVSSLISRVLLKYIENSGFMKNSTGKRKKMAEDDFSDIDSID